MTLRRLAARSASLVLIAPLLLGCRRDGAATPPNFSAPLAEQLLGAPAEIAGFVDLAGVARDPVYGPLLASRRPGLLGRDGDLRWIEAHVDRVDVWVLGLGDDARDLTGLAVLRSGRIREASLHGIDLKYDRRLELASGAVMFVLRPGRISSAMFLVDGHLVLAAGSAIAPTQQHFSTSRTLPPALDLGRDVLAGLHARQPALARADPAHGGQALAASLVWRTGRHGDIFAVADFADDAAAANALTWARELPDAAADHARGCPALAPVGVQVEHARRTVSVRFTGVPQIVAVSLDRSLCDR
jgi:hypothetical protein